MRGKRSFRKLFQNLKGEKRGKTLSEILKQPLENTLGFKRIQTLQVLET